MSPLSSMQPHGRPAVAALAPVPSLVTAAGLAKKLKGLTLFRIVLVTFLIGATAFVGIETLQPPGKPPLWAAVLYGAAAVMCGLSFVYVVGLRVLHAERHLKWLAYVEIAGDVLFAAVLVLLTDRTGSVFTFFFSLTIVNAAIILYRPGALFAATACSLMFLFVGLDEMGTLSVFSLFGMVGQVVEPSVIGEDGFGGVRYNLVVNTVAFYAIAFLGAYLAEQLRRSDIKLEERRVSFEDLRALHENIVASIQSGLVTVNQHRQITYFNRVAEEMTGLRQSDVLFRDITRFFTDLKHILLNEDKLESHHAEQTVQVLRGEVIYLTWTISPLVDARGAAIGHVLIFDDVTKVKGMEDQVKRAEEFATVGKLAQVLAHEIRNPLASISGAIQLLRNTLDLDEDSKRLMGIINRETDALSQWITDFLTYARPRMGERVRIDISEMIHEAVTVLRHDEKLGEIDIEVRAGQPALILGDSTYIKQVIWNLLTNAVQAMPDGGRLEIEVEPGETQRGPMHRIRFSDTGPGILPELRERIFEPFFTTKEKGTGLGLPTVFRIVNEHDGSVTIDPAVRHGTTMVVELPRLIEEPAAAEGGP